MESEFEMLEFETEGERGRRGGGGGGGGRAARGPGRSPARAPAQRGKMAPPRRPGPGIPGPRPRWPLGYGGWPYGGVVVQQPVVYAGEPEPDPAAQDPGWDAPQEPGMDEPFDQGQDQFEWYGETPATLQAAVGRLPAPLRPSYVALGTLNDALRDPRSNVAGLYAIEFNVAGQPRAYSGQSGNVRRRLQQHVLCATMLGLPISGHRAFVAPLPSAAPPQRRDIERRIHTDMLARQPGVLTNQRREFEAELLGPIWR
jgi:hypothetical protein